MSLFTATVTISTLHTLDVLNRTLGYDARLPMGSGLAYLIVIFSLQRAMANRKPMELRLPFAAHNGILFVFSLVVFLGQTYEFIKACRVRIFFSKVKQFFIFSVYVLSNKKTTSTFSPLRENQISITPFQEDMLFQIMRIDASTRSILFFLSTGPFVGWIYGAFPPRFPES
jgi:hypothetical protein